VDSSLLIGPLSQPTGGVVTRGHSFKLRKRLQDLSQSDVLGFRIVNLWNDLPAHLVTADSVNIFNNHFDKHCLHLRFCTDIDRGQLVEEEMMMMCQ